MVAVEVNDAAFATSWYHPGDFVKTLWHPYVNPSNKKYKTWHLRLLAWLYQLAWNLDGKTRQIGIFALIFGDTALCPCCQPLRLSWKDLASPHTTKMPS